MLIKMYKCKKCGDNFDASDIYRHASVCFDIGMSFEEAYDCYDVYTYNSKDKIKEVACVETRPTKQLS
jgi:hypothetical protein